MKCLSVSQPFADLIISGRKKIELRSWNTKFRGEFLIHAPLKIRIHDAKRLKMKSEFVTGAIVGKAEIFDVKKYETAAEYKKDAHLHFAAKKFSDIRYGFMLKRAKMFRIPIPYKGKLGFFEAVLPESNIKESDIVTDIIDEEYRYQWIGHH